MESIFQNDLNSLHFDFEEGKGLKRRFVILIWNFVPVMIVPSVLTFDMKGCTCCLPLPSFQLLSLMFSADFYLVFQ